MSGGGRTGRTGRLRLATVVVLALSVLALLGPGPATAAEPGDGTIRWRGTVEWSGGPFSAASNRFASFAGLTAGKCAQDEGLCDEFLLDVQVASSPDPNRTRFVHIEVETSVPDALLLFVVPPGGEPARDFLFFHEQGAVRLADPDPGTWRVRAMCANVFTCKGVTYEARASTGAVVAPTAVAHGPGGEFRGNRDGLRGHIDQVDAHAFEPTLGIAEDGSIFYQAITFANAPFRTQVPRVLRSTGDGDWKDVSPKAGTVERHRNTQDPYLHLDPDTGRVFTVDFQLPTAACHQLSFTDDAKAWTTTAICGQADFQKVFTGPPALSPTAGYPNVVYMCSFNGGFGSTASTAVTCSKSLDGGIGFVPTGTPPFHDDPRQLAEDDAEGTGVHGHCNAAAGPGAVGPDGTVFLPAGYCGQPHLAISHDEGATWQRVQVSDLGLYRGAGSAAPVPVVPLAAGFERSVSLVTSVAADEAGNVYFAWVARDRLPYLAISRDGGQTWGEPMMIAPPGVREANLVDIHVRDTAFAGAPPRTRVALAYMGSETSPGPPFPDEKLDCEARVQKTCVGASFPEDPDEAYAEVTWNGYLTVSDDVLEDRPTLVSVPVNDPADPLVRGRCGPARCQWAGDFFDVKIASDGTPHAAFVDTCVVDACGDFHGGWGIVGRLVDRGRARPAERNARDVEHLR